MRDKTVDIKIRWFCRECWQQGIAAVTVRLTTNVRPNKAELLRMAAFCHVRKIDGGECLKPDIRLHYDTKEIYEERI